MSIRFFEGFETVGTSTGEANRNDIIPNAKKRWSSIAESISPSTDGPYLIDDGFSEGYAMHMGNGSLSNTCALIWEIPSELREAPDNTNKPWVIGLRVHIPSVSRSWNVINVRGILGVSYPNQLLLKILNSTDLQLVNLPAGSEVEVARVNGVFASDQWFYIEMKFNHANSGNVVVRVDDNVLINETGVDTNNTSDSLERFSFNGASSGGTSTDFVGYDDFYFSFDQTVSEDFLDDSRIRSLLPNGDYAKNWDNISVMTLATTLNAASETTLDVGTDGIPDGTPQTGYLYVELDSGYWRKIEYTAHDNDDEFTIVDESWVDPNDATAGNDVELRDELDNYRTVDENGIDDNDYIETDQSQSVDNYHLTDDTSGLPTNSEVHAVKVEVEALNLGGGTPAIELRIDSNGNVDVSDEFDVTDTTTYVLYDHMAEKDPNGDVTWTITAVNSAKAGIRMDNKFN